MQAQQRSQFSSARTTKRFPSPRIGVRDEDEDRASLESTWTLCSTGAGGPNDRNCNRVSLHLDVLSPYYLQRSAISASVIRFCHATQESFSSATPFCLANL